MMGKRIGQCGIIGVGLRIIPVELFSTTQHSIAVPGHSCPCCINALGNPKSDAASEFEFTTHHEMPGANRIHTQRGSPYTGKLIGHRGDELTVDLQRAKGRLRRQRPVLVG